MHCVPQATLLANVSTLDDGPKLMAVKLQTLQALGNFTQSQRKGP